MSAKDEIARLKAENEALKRASGSTITLKIGAKGGISAYGLGRFPVTLYKDQWERLLAEGDRIKAFIEDNAANLKVKGSEAAVAQSGEVETR